MRGGSRQGPQGTGTDCIERFDRGFILPLAIVLLPAFLALSFSAFVLAQGQLHAARLDTLLLEAMATAAPPQGVLPAAGEEELSLGAGYVLLRAPAAAMAPNRRGLRLAWRLDPGATAGEWARQPEGEAFLGPVPLAGILLHLERSAVGGVVAPDSEGGWNLEGGHRLDAPGGLLIRSPEGVALLLAPGGARLSGAGPLSGVILSDGGIEVGGESILRGAARSGGRLHFEPESALVPDSAVIHAALAHGFPGGLLPVPGGGRMGRH